MDRSNAARHVELLTRVLDATARWLAVPVLCLTAAAAWIDGDGALMACCLERAHTIEPGYSMLRLLGDVNRAGTDPALWDEIRSAAFDDAGTGNRPSPAPAAGSPSGRRVAPPGRSAHPRRKARKQGVGIG
jgi:hypothetical protein